MKKTLGIIGGMGPQSSIRFLEHVMNRCTESFNVINNDDFPRVLLSSLPAPDIIENMDREKEAQGMLIHEAVRLQCSGADFLVMTCNTMHILSQGIVDVITIPFLSIIDTVCDEVTSKGVQTVGLLGSETTMTTGLYRDPLLSRGISTVVPSTQERRDVVDSILKTIAGKQSQKDTDCIVRVTESLAAQGAEAVILGCTELPLLVEQSMTDVTVLDSLALLAEASCKEIFCSH